MSGVAVFSFLPCCTCLFWLVLTALISKRNLRQGYFTVLLLSIGLSTMAQAGLDFASSQKYTLLFYFADQFFTTAVIPLAFIYLKHEESFDNGSGMMFSWIAAPVTLLFAELVLYRLYGKEDFATCVFNLVHNVTTESPDRIHFYTDICSRYVYTAILALGTLFFSIRTAVMRNRVSAQISFLITLLAAIYTINAVLADILYIGYPLIRIILSILLSAAIFILSYNGSHLSYYTSEKYSVMDSAPVFPTVKESPDTIDRSENGRAETPEFHLPVAKQEQIYESVLRVRFENLIIKNRYYLKPGITLVDVARELGTNRTYISRMVNKTYDITFTDYINTLRIDYAQKYLLQHKDAKQSEIAAACGFPNASVFNNIFRKKTGVTPKIWVATNS